MNIPKLLSVSLSVLALASTAMAQSFFTSGITLQGKSIDLGNAGRVYRWAALSTNGNVSATTTFNTSPNNIDFEGNVGVWGSSANLIMTNSRILGSRYIRVGATPILTGSSIAGGGVSGSSFQDAATNTILSTAAANVATLSANIQSLTKTTNFTLSGFTNNTPSALSKIIASGSGDNTANINLTINGTGAANPLNQPIVLKLSDFVLNEAGGTQLTLVGTATTKFIIDVSGQFSLANSSDIILSGGLLASNVIFNARATSGAGLGGGSTLKGILVANKGVASLSGASIVTGQVIGKSIALSGASKIRTVSP